MYVATYIFVYEDGQRDEIEFEFQTIDEAFDFVGSAMEQDGVDYCELTYYEFVIR